jgi:hypothetical protein
LGRGAAFRTDGFREGVGGKSLRRRNTPGDMGVGFMGLPARARLPAWLPAWLPDARGADRKRGRPMGNGSWSSLNMQLFNL